MSPVTIVGMALGTLVIVTALGVFWSKKEFPAGGVGAILLGTVLVGMSQWTSVSVKGAGFEFAALQRQIDSTAAGAAVVAHEAQRAAAAAETTRQQIETLTTQLEARSVVSPQTANSIRRATSTAPRPDTLRLKIATDQLRNLSKGNLRARVP